MRIRKLYHQILPELISREVCVITGPRQSGKTTLLNQLANYLKGKAEYVVVLTLEDHSVLSRLNQHPENIFEFVSNQENQRIFILIDEIQYLSDPSNFLKLLYDKHAGQIKLVVTGSSAFYIDQKFKDSLAGRKRLFELFTLSFEEFLEFRTDSDELSKELSLMREQSNYRPPTMSQIKTLFNEFLTFGGYPAVVLADHAEEKRAILNDLLNSFIKRDIQESNISNPDKFYQLMLLLSHQTGSLMNMHELSLTLRIAATTVENYLYVLRKCYHVFLLKPFYGNIRKELTKMPKAYFNDLGLRNTLMNQFNPVFQRIDRGEIAENYAFIRLRESSAPESLHFWRTTEGNEIDFIYHNRDGSGHAMEIKYNDSLFQPIKYKAFTSAYPDIHLTVRAIETEDTQKDLIRL